MHRAGGTAAHAFEPDRHCQQRRDLQADFHQRIVGEGINVTSARQMADLKRRGEHREQNGSGVQSACRHIVGAPAQQGAPDPECDRRDAIAPQQPVEDRRRADLAEDARLPGDVCDNHKRAGGGEPSQERQRAFLRDHGDAGRHQGERDGEPALLQR